MNSLSSTPSSRSTADIKKISSNILPKKILRAASKKELNTIHDLIGASKQQNVFVRMSEDNPEFYSQGYVKLKENKEFFRKNTRALNGIDSNIKIQDFDYVVKDQFTGEFRKETDWSKYMNKINKPQTPEEEPKVIIPVVKKIEPENWKEYFNFGLNKKVKSVLSKKTYILNQKNKQLPKVKSKPMYLKHVQSKIDSFANVKYDEIEQPDQYLPYYKMKALQKFRHETDEYMEQDRQERINKKTLKHILWPEEEGGPLNYSEDSWNLLSKEYVPRNDKYAQANNLQRKVATVARSIEAKEYMHHYVDQTKYLRNKKEKPATRLQTYKKPNQTQFEFPQERQPQILSSQTPTPNVQATGQELGKQTVTRSQNLNKIRDKFQSRFDTHNPIEVLDQTPKNNQLFSRQQATNSGLKTERKGLKSYSKGVVDSDSGQLFNNSVETRSNTFRHSKIKISESVPSLVIKTERLPQNRQSFPRAVQFKDNQNADIVNYDERQTEVLPSRENSIEFSGSEIFQNMKNEKAEINTVSGSFRIFDQKNNEQGQIRQTSQTKSLPQLIASSYADRQTSQSVIQHPKLTQKQNETQRRKSKLQVQPRTVVDKSQEFNEKLLLNKGLESLRKDISHAQSQAKIISKPKYLVSLNQTPATETQSRITLPETHIHLQSKLVKSKRVQLGNSSANESEHTVSANKQKRSQLIKQQLHKRMEVSKTAQTSPRGGFKKNDQLTSKLSQELQLKQNPLSNVRKRQPKEQNGGQKQSWNPLTKLDTSVQMTTQGEEYNSFDQNMQHQGHQIMFTNQPGLINIQTTSLNEKRHDLKRNISKQQSPTIVRNASQRNLQLANQSQGKQQIERTTTTESRTTDEDGNTVFRRFAVKPGVGDFGTGNQIGAIVDKFDHLQSVPKEGKRDDVGRAKEILEASQRKEAKKFFKDTLNKVMRIAKHYVREQRVRLKSLGVFNRVQITSDSESIENDENRSHTYRNKKDAETQEFLDKFMPEREESEMDKTSFSSASSYNSSLSDETSTITESSEGSEGSDLELKKELEQERIKLRQIRRKSVRVFEQQTKSADAKSIIEREMKLRERFGIRYKKFVKQMSANQVVVMPDEDVPILEMIPKIDLISTAVYTKAIPKCIRLSLLLSNELFRDKMIYAKNQLGFQKALVRDHLKALTKREQMNSQLFPSKPNYMVSNHEKTKEELDKMDETEFLKHQEEQKNNTQYAWMTQLMPRQATSQILKKSDSSKVSRFHLNDAVREMIFGAYKAKILIGNEENPFGRILSFLDEDQLLHLNQRICEFYQKELAVKKMKEMKLIANDDVTAEGGYAMEAQEYRKLIYGTSSYEGPKLIRKAGHIRFHDNIEQKDLPKNSLDLEIENPLLVKMSTSLFNRAAKRTDKNHRGAIFASRLELLQEKKKKLQEKVELEDRLNIMKPYFDIIQEEIYNSLRQKMISQILNVTGKHAEATAQPLQSVKSSSTMLSDKKKSPKSFLFQLMDTMESKQKSQSEARVAGQISRVNGSARKGMLTRKDAHSQINVKYEKLPISLRENTLQADSLLFKEAQVQYLGRKTELHKQIVIDNIQFCLDQKRDELENLHEQQIKKKKERISKLISQGKQVAKKVEEQLPEEERIKRKLSLLKKEQEKAKQLKEVKESIALFKIN